MRVDDLIPEPDILLTTTPSPPSLLLSLSLSAALFPPSFPSHLLHTLRSLLALAVAHPGRKTSLLNPLTRLDRKLVASWNARPPVAAPACLHHLFDQQARRRPGAPAVCAWDGSYSYAQLAALANKVAHRLVQLGVGPEVLVAWAFEKSKFAVIASLAILKAGGAFVPLDASHPTQRLASILARAEAKLILASAKTAPALASFSLPILIIDDALVNSLPPQVTSPKTRVSPSNAAFVLFTSGSTGHPKGLVQQHGSVCSVNQAYQQALHLDQHSRVLNFAAYTFDVSTVDVFATLSLGGCVCIPSEEERLNNLELVIQRFGITWLDLTPSFALASLPDPRRVPSLQTLVLAGEALKPEQVAHFVGLVPRVINCYGPAEAGGCLAQTCEAGDSGRTVGRAIASARCWVVDVRNARWLASVGAVGELVVEGPTLARGYLGDEERSKAVFERHWGWRCVDRLRRRRRFYRTGDLVRYRMDGSIDFVGRRDTQAKIRGQRIELAEIEHHLARHPSVKQCLVDVPDSGLYAQRLVAVIEPRLALAQPTPLQLVPDRLLLDDASAMLAAKLPAYMVPSAWLMVSSLALTDSKKVDRRRVRVWLSEAETLAGERAPLVSDNGLKQELSSRVGGIIANGNEKAAAALTGRDFDLVAAGIDSIQVMTLSRWIHERYAVKLTVDKLLCPGLTISGLAGLVSAHQLGQPPESDGVDIMQQVDALASLIKANAPPHSFPPGPVSSVFLTGATGFLGIEILHQLLATHNTHIIIHVRAASAQHGLERIVDAATQAKWWCSSYAARLEIWPGNLSAPRLGLDAAKWARLTGEAQPAVDAIIHNGAAVQWNRSYHSLCGANTLSTLQLLQALAGRGQPARFVHVSGGQLLSATADDDALLAHAAAHATGYAQSKLVSELLVKRFAASSSANQHLVRIVKPSFIIGDVPHGLANTSDYLWALTKTAIQLGSYSRPSSGWLYVCPVGAVARAVCEAVLLETRPLVVKILEGVAMRDYWAMLTRDFAYPLQPVDAADWWARLRAHVAHEGPRHCLWALQDILHGQAGNVASPTPPAPDVQARSGDVLAAIRSNVLHLQDVRFLPPVSSQMEAIASGGSSETGCTD
ncbi:hypothetical protein CDD81_2587 [Ophiocordyceps australis]|uniref:Carrier domain-containing protein n=1 Tax=Ophiocordyceps australis TaxID=1399860 RepID=A0A2C5XWL8_9HYPO|nr:hypothetical protein CDD81_2587 [Ophiocordyceps australis]